MDNSFQQKAIILLYHKHPTSAKTVFFKANNDQLCLFDTIPNLASVCDKNPDDLPLVIHPSPLLSDVCKWLDIAQDEIELENEFVEYIDVPNGIITVFLARFSAIDPPQQKAEAVKARFIALTDARTCTEVEIELLRRAYTHILG